MKNYIAPFCLAASLLFSACDNYLDLVPKGESVLNQTSDYLGLIEDMYGLPIDTEFYLAGDASYYDMSIIENYTIPLNSAAFFWDEAFDRAAYSTATGTQDVYASCYRKIARYNIIIEHINNSVGPQEEKVLGMAQAKVMRAFMYFNLINTFAAPYNPETASSDRGIILRTEFNLDQEGRQSTVADAYRLIQEDIEEALEDLPHVAENNFRPNKSFGYALKAKVHLFKREFDQALNAALFCIEEAESNGNHRLFNMNTNYGEAMDYILSMYGGAMPEEFFEYNGMMYSMFRTMSMSIFFVRPYDDAENLLYVHGYNAMSPSPTIVRKPVIELFNPRDDLRYTYALGTMPARPTQEPGSLSASNTMIKWNVAGLRLSEAYLMVAECYARAGESLLAMEYINQLRKSRINQKYYSDLLATDATDAFRIVREERKRDLLLTTNSFFDMRRFSSEFSETLTREYKGEVYTLSPTSHLLIQPFPVSATQNSEIIQNSK